MSGLSYSQTSGNDWSTIPAEMLSEVVQTPPRRTSTKVLRFDEQYAQQVEEQIERQMAQFEAEHDAAIANLRREYIFVDDQSIRTFLRSHRTAPQLLFQALPYLRRNFGVETLLRLYSTADEYGAQTLYASVVWPGNIQDVRAALDRFDEQWWIANSHQASGDVTFTYELV